MAQYINKDIVIEEINRQYNYLREHPSTYGASFILGFRQAGWQIIDFCNSLQAKELDLDLEKEINIKWDECNPIDEGMGREFATIGIEQFYFITKYFFELGLNIHKGE